LIEFNEVKNAGRSLYKTKRKWENQAEKNVQSLEKDGEEILLTAVPYCTKQFRLEQNFIHRRNCI
jgi:hypothetical protein